MTTCTIPGWHKVLQNNRSFSWLLEPSIIYLEYTKLCSCNIFKTFPRMFPETMCFFFLSHFFLFFFFLSFFLSFLADCIWFFPHTKYSHHNSWKYLSCIHFPLPIMRYYSRVTPTFQRLRHWPGLSPPSPHALLVASASNRKATNYVNTLHHFPWHPQHPIKQLQQSHG